jgi:general secretion pathway protein J
VRAGEPARAPPEQAARYAAPGFTLIELLVALFITAILFVMGYGAINQALKDRKVIDTREQRLTAVQTAMRVIVQDFTQLTPRPVRDETGNGSLPCLIGSAGGISVTAQPDSLGGSSGAQDSSDSSGSTDLDLVAFTRAGWANPAGIQRPAEERVSYRLVNGVLERQSWPELDATESTPFVTRKLLGHVKSIEFSYLDQSRQWTDQWPPLARGANSAVAGNQTLRMRPLAVKVTLVLEDWGTIVRIIEVPT